MSASPSEHRDTTRAHYMLRRNLPLWKPAEIIDETLSFCEKAGIAEVIWKVDVEEFNHGFTPHSLIREFIPWLEKARQCCQEKEILFSINPWVTLNHVDRSRYLDGPPEGFYWRVRANGEDARERACPLSAGWQEWFFEAYRLYATTKPDKLWLEDDFKTFPENSVELGCFCGAHIEAFTQRIGRKIKREELAELLIRPGQPDQTRSEWLDFQGEIMVDICRQLEKVVHAESPNTRLGLMNSWSTDGRWWSDAISGLAGPLRPLARTSLGPYQESRPSLCLPDQSDMLKESSCLPSNTENCPDVNGGAKVQRLAGAE